MDTWESLADKGVEALKADNAEEAAQHFSDAIDLNGPTHELLFSRGTAYVKLEQWKEAVEDLEKAAELKPDYEKGQARLAVAQFGNKDFIGARRSYQKALELNPGNEEYERALTACKDATDKASSDNAAKKAMPELVEKLKDPAQIAKLKAHKTTGPYFKDPEFLAMLEAMQNDPKEIPKHLTDPRMLQCVGVMLDMPLVDTMANAQLKREQFTISSDEEEESEDSEESDTDDDDGQSLPQPLSRTKVVPKADAANEPAVYQDGLLKGLPIQGGDAGGPGPGPGIHKVGDPNSQSEQLRQQVAAKLGMTVEQMDRMSRFAHTGSFNPQETPAAGEGDGADAAAATTPGANPTSAPSGQADATPQPAAGNKPRAAVIEVEDDPAEVFLPDTVPDDAPARVALAEAVKVEATDYYKQRKFHCSLKLYEFGHTLDPTNMIYKLNMAAAYLELKDYDKCIACCDEAMALGEAAEAGDKLMGKAYYRRGRALAGLQKYDEAIAALKKALDLNRCAEYLKAKNNALKARERFLAEREHDPLKAQGCKARGNDLYHKGEYPQAIAEYERAIRHDPKNPALLSRVYSNRAACYTKMGEMTLAMQDADACIKADPTFVKGYLRKGQIYLMTEQWPEAESIYTKALELDPHNYDARTSLEKAKKGRDLLSKTAATRAELAMQRKDVRELWEELRWLLKEMSEDPESAKVKKELEDPIVRAKLAKLREAGLM